MKASGRVRRKSYNSPFVRITPSKVLTDPAPFVRVVSHGESTINIVTRVWTKNENYWDVYFDMMEAIKQSFDNAKIEIPFNQLDVHIKEK